MRWFQWFCHYIGRGSFHLNPVWCWRDDVGCDCFVFSIYSILYWCERSRGICMFVCQCFFHCFYFTLHHLLLLNLLSLNRKHFSIFTEFITSRRLIHSFHAHFRHCSLIPQYPQCSILFFYIIVLFHSLSCPQCEHTGSGKSGLLNLSTVLSLARFFFSSCFSSHFQSWFFFALPLSNCFTPVYRSHQCCHEIVPIINDASHENYYYYCHLFIWNIEDSCFQYFLSPWNRRHQPGRSWITRFPTQNVCVCMRLNE